MIVKLTQPGDEWKAANENNDEGDDNINNDEIINAYEMNTTETQSNSLAKDNPMFYKEANKTTGPKEDAPSSFV
jgi:hypothetical protein